MKYTKIFGSQFPKHILEQKTFKDVDQTVLPLVNQIKTLQNAGDFEGANTIIENNKELLSSYMLSSNYLNFLCEETRNLEIFATTLTQNTLYQDSEPDSDMVDKNMIWIGR